MCVYVYLYPYKPIGVCGIFFLQVFVLFLQVCPACCMWACSKPVELINSKSHRFPYMQYACNAYKRLFIEISSLTPVHLHQNGIRLDRTRSDPREMAIFTRVKWRMYIFIILWFLKNKYRYLYIILYQSAKSVYESCARIVSPIEILTIVGFICT